jgi:hypothetical protein
MSLHLREQAKVAVTKSQLKQYSINLHAMFSFCIFSICATKTKTGKKDFYTEHSGWMQSGSLESSWTTSTEYVILSKLLNQAFL